MKLTADILKQTIDTLHIGIVLVDNDDKIVLFNRVAGEMLKQDPTSRVGTSIYRCHGGVSEPVVKKMLTDIRSGTLKYYEGWVDYLGRMLFEHIYPIRDEKGKCILVLEELHDAAEKAEHLKSRSEWKDIHVSGVGAKSPRSPKP